MIANNAQRIMPNFGKYTFGNYFDLYDIRYNKEYNIDDVIEIEKYIEETFIPGVSEIMDQIINLYNVTLVMGSCVIRSMDGIYGNYFVVNDTFMEDYIYRFIGLRNKIEEYIEIYHEFIENICPSMMEHYRSWVHRIFDIIYNEKENRIWMCSRTKNYDFYCGIHVEEKFRYLKDIVPESW